MSNLLPITVVQPLSMTSSRKVEMNASSSNSIRAFDRFVGHILSFFSTTTISNTSPIPAMSTRQPFPTELSIPLPSFPNDDRDRDGTKTPRTPADEALSYFSSPLSPSSLSNPIQVFELPLEPDGGPSKERSYIRLPPAYTPYILRVILEAGTPASRNAVFRTNFPLDGGMFEREKFCERKYVFCFFPFFSLMLLSLTSAVYIGYLRISASRSRWTSPSRTRARSSTGWTTTLPPLPLPLLYHNGSKAEKVTST